MYKTNKNKNGKASSSEQDQQHLSCLLVHSIKSTTLLQTVQTASRVFEANKQWRFTVMQTALKYSQ